MSDLFASSLLQRLAGATALAALAWGGVWAVERAYARPTATATATAAAAAGGRTIAVACTASRPVARWRVALDGAEVAGDAGESRWSAALAAPAARCELVVEADPGRPGTTALRVQVEPGGAPIERTVWADGPARITLLLPRAR